MKRDEYQALVASLEGLTPEQLELLSRQGVGHE